MTTVFRELEYMNYEKYEYRGNFKINIRKNSSGGLNEDIGKS